MKKISVYGSSYSDICLLLGSVLAELGEKVEMLVTDPEAQLWYYLPKVRGSEKGDIGELGKIGFIRSSDEIADDTTYLFEICGLKPAKKKIYDINRFVMVVTGEEPEILHRLDILDASGEFVTSDSTHRFIVLRDCMGMLTKGRSWAKPENVGRIFELRGNRRDRRAELYLALREDMSYQRVSERFGSFIEKLVCIVRETTTVKEFEAAYRKTMKGGHL